MTYGVPCVVLVFAFALAGCNGSTTNPTPLPSEPRVSPLPPRDATPAFHVSDVTLSGVVFEMTAGGRRPIEGVMVANGEGNAAVTDANGHYAMRPVWNCPCAAEPFVPPGMTFLWVSRDGFTDPPGLPRSVFDRGRGAPGWRDVMIDGDTRYDIELVRN